jgi:steroid delta-isomerase-like uncharacterized protein
MTGQAMTLEANKAVVRRYIDEVINQRHFDLIDELFAPAMRDKVRGFLAEDDDAFPDGVEEIQDLVAEGDLVMARWILRGTHRAPFLGLPATGKRIEVHGYSTYRFKDGLIEWDTMSAEWLEAVEQVGGRVVGADGE